MRVHLRAGATSREGKGRGRCGVSQGREDCGRGVGIRCLRLVSALEGWGCVLGGQGEWALWGLSGPRGLWEGVGIRCLRLVSALEGWGCE